MEQIQIQELGEKNTALMIAAKKGNKESVEFLLDHKANINLKNNEDNNALTIASNYGHTEIIKLLVKHQADLINDGFAALNAVIMGEMSDEEATAVFELLLNLGANIKPTAHIETKIVQNSWGESSLEKSADFQTSINFARESRTGIIKILANFGIHCNPAQYRPQGSVSDIFSKFAIQYYELR